jgi:SpoVK/Ycf46/Vps4 family AAA+-type ATPase
MAEEKGTGQDLVAEMVAKKFAEAIKDYDEDKSNLFFIVLEERLLAKGVKDIEKEIDEIISDVEMVTDAYYNEIKSGNKVLLEELKP